MRDLELNDAGDLVVQDSDFKVASSIRTDLQVILWRVQTELGSIATDPELGIPSIFRGNPLSQELLAILERTVTDQLIRGGFLLPGQFMIKAAYAMGGIVLYIDVLKSYGDERYFTVAFNLDPHTGMVSRLTGDIA